MNEVAPNQQNLIIYNTLDGKVSVTMMARDGNVWMNQKQMAELFATSVPNVNIHISNILKERELDKDSVIKDYLITAALNHSAGYYINNILKNNELALNSVVKNFFITAADGKLYDVTFYSNKEKEAHVLAVYEQFDQRRKQADALLADQMDDKELKQLEHDIVNRK